MTFEARVSPRRIAPALGGTVLLLAIGLAAALAGVAMGWVLAAFMLWSAAGLARRMRRRDPVLTIDAAGVRDARLPVAVAWDEVERLRTVDRRVMLSKVPLLELVPKGRFDRDRSQLVRAVLRGDVSLADARDEARLMLDLRYLDVTPEQVMAAVREHRPAPDRTGR